MSECISAPSEHFSDYDQALDAGFVALHRHRAGRIDALPSKCAPSQIPLPADPNAG